LADRLNSLYVVSSTLEDPDWNNSTVLKGDVVNEVSKLKQELDGEIVVYGSLQLVRTLIEHDLVDELRLMIYPVVLGAGERLFCETSDKKPLRLVGTQTGGDVAFLTYEPVRATLLPCATSSAPGPPWRGRDVLTGIIGSRRAWTVSMISALSMPCW
jgi:dihydrofolate reductase